LQRQLASGPVVSGPKVRWGVTGLDAKGRFIQISSVIAERGESGVRRRHNAAGWRLQGGPS
jgi:hypothetical protein